MNGYREARENRREELAAQAAWIINGVRSAYHDKHFKAFKPEDLYDPGHESDVDLEDDSFLDDFPDTL